jgi:ubiquinone/menaquinone biosynthesis C-methylase UbiE
MRPETHKHEHVAVEGNIEAMPFADGTFATVVCTEVLEHVPYPTTALDEIHRVVRPGGILIGSVPAHSAIWRLRFLSSTCPRNESFHKEYAPDEVRTMLHRFDVKRIWLSALHFNVMFVAGR